jgi:hypothetical protein
MTSDLPMSLTAVGLHNTTNNNNKMSPSSNGDSPHSLGGVSNSGRPFPLPSRENFTIEVPSPQLHSIANGSNLKSPSSAKTARTSFSREGILGSAQKARNLSQSSEQRPDQVMNGMQKGTSSDEAINPLKRRNTDATVDYPRRRATIAVG